MTKKLDKKQILLLIRNVLFTVVGTALLAFGTAVFIVPFDLVTGGVAGIAIVIDKIAPFDWITIDLTVTVITWALFFAGLFILGKAFAAKTLLSTIVYPIALSLSLKLVDPGFMGGFFAMQNSQYGEISILLAALFGGVFVGAGCAIAFLGGGSTGGVDILAFILCKYFKRLRSSVVIFVISATVVVFGMFVLKDPVLSLLGILSAFIEAMVVDKLFVGESQGFIAQIISDKYDVLNRAVIEKLERTTTVLDVTGGFSGEKKKMVVVSLTMRQYAELRSLINRVDPTAFVTLHRAHEINGEGWTW